MIKIGVLAFQGSVIEHIHMTRAAAIKLKMDCEIIEVRTKQNLEILDALIIPGGESTVFYKLCEREGMLDGIKTVPAIFGTCAGTIMLAKKITGGQESGGQKTLGLMDIEVDRNAYGRQTDSFETDIVTKLDPEPIHAIFIRAPKIKSIGTGVTILAQTKKDIVACEQKSPDGRYYLAACFHPELSTTVFHEYFLKQIKQSVFKLQKIN